MNENLTVSAGKLFCSACREEVSLKRSITANHIHSTKHKQSKTNLMRKESRERHIALALAVYDEHMHPRGETLPTDQRVYRIKVVTAFLKAGVPLAKLNPLVEQVGGFPSSCVAVWRCTSIPAIADWAFSSHKEQAAPVHGRSPEKCTVPN